MDKNLNRFEAELTDVKMIHKIIVYTGKQIQKRDDILVLPFQEFLDNLRKDTITLHAQGT